MGITYFRVDTGYIAVTTESPKGFKDIVFVGKGPKPGGGPDTVVEQAWAVNQLQGFEKVKADDVPDDWFAAFGYEQRQPKPEPTPEPAPEPEPVEPEAAPLPPEPPVEIDVSWWPFNPPAAPKKMTAGDRRQADLIVLAIVLAAVVFAFLRI